MNKSNTSSTFAWHNARIIFIALSTPAEATLSSNSRLSICLLFTFTFLFAQSDDLSSFFEFLLEKLLFSETHVLTCEVFHAEFEASELDHIEFLYLVSSDELNVIDAWIEKLLKLFETFLSIS